MSRQQDYVYIGIGALAAVLLTSYMPGAVATESLGSRNIIQKMSEPPRIERIQGIDLQALNTARRNGF